ncbi:MAG: phosphoenolpyruvate--protein phosphotransferase [Nitrospinae bacterium CG11_big_fil_rev_8_21_14_0_20_56_8]|nr:MAG: phosphoenolpyruvate--protein phosphotransferase [Nitrospinae bacterium CG11_big_fil_rev_8_21_14_0_20_56_8]
MFNGIAASKGVAIGKAYILDSSKFCVVKHQLEPGKVDAEVRRLRDAIEQSKAQMQEIKKRASKVADKYAVILDTYTLLLEDEILVSDTIDRIRKDGINAEWALTQTLEKFGKLFSNINDEYLKGKKDDLDLVVQGILRNLIGHNQESLSEIEEPVVVVAHSLSASDTLMMPKSFVLGLATEVGGKTSHLGIFASALGIPAVVGVKGITEEANTGDLVVIDGIDGQILVNPSEKLLVQYKKKQDNYRRYEIKLLQDIHEPAETKDGTKIKILANIESAHEIKSLRKFGAEGVGLYRTEFLYMGSVTLPSEQELYENFKKVAQGSAPHPAIIRTLDIGMDKNPHFLNREDENNPALGLRGIRLSLAYPKLFISQLKAILRASLYGNLKILYPMISCVEEIRQANEFLQLAKNQLQEEEIPSHHEIEVGAMIETPAAAICIERILQEVDFVSIGTNDLIQYILAVDRINENVAHLYQPFHPAVLKTLKSIFNVAETAGKTVSICGELGGDPLATMLLLGLGKIDELSMEPHAIPKVKKILRKITLNEARKVADHALTLNSPEEVNRFIVAEMKSRFPADFNQNLDFEENSKSTAKTI